MYIHSIKLDNRSDKNFRIEKAHGLIDYVYLVIKTPCVLAIRTQVYSIASPTAILIDSHTPYKYTSLSDDYEDDYFHFAIKDKESFIGELTFPFNSLVTLSDYKPVSDILRLIREEFIQQNEYPQSEEVLFLLTKYLMIKTGQQWNKMNYHDREAPHYEQLVKLREQIMVHPDKNWTINELAESVHLSIAYFQVLYKRTFGTTCINDVIEARISHAKELLLSTNYSVNEISKLLGYNEVYHFIRQFKKIVGLTPGSFRKKMI